MPNKNKKNAKAQKQTHFELVPVEVVVKIAAVDTPSELAPAPAQRIVQPPPPKSPSRTKG
jgi:hypothetical protein